MNPRVFRDVDDGAVAFFREHGWVLTCSLDDTEAAQLRDWVDDVMAWPDDGEWLHYREMTDAGPRLCRTENFVPFHAGLRALLTEGAMAATAGALLGEPAVLYKEKINYKCLWGRGLRAPPGRACVSVRRVARLVHGRRRRRRHGQRMSRGRVTLVR